GVLGPQPLVVAVGDHQAPRPAVLDEVAERRLLAEGLGAGVDHPRADAHVLGPERDEPPSQQAHAPLALARGDDREDVLGRRDVVALAALGGRRRRRLREHMREALALERVREAAAHATHSTTGPCGMLEACGASWRSPGRGTSPPSSWPRG